MVAECDISTTANRTVTLKCPLSSAPNTVSWMKDGHRVETDKSYTFHSVNGSLDITKVGELLFKFLWSPFFLYIFRIAGLSLCRAPKAASGLQINTSVVHLMIEIIPFISS